MLFIFILLLALAASLGYHRYMGVHAMRPDSVEVSGLTLDQIIDIGTKASMGVVKRMLGRPQAYQTPDGAMEWQTQSKGGAMIFRVTPLSGGAGYRVEGWADKVWVARVSGQMDHRTAVGQARILTNVLCKALGIPQNARQLLRRRRRALRAIAQAGVDATIRSSTQTSAQADQVVLPPAPKSDWQTAPVDEA